jgi:hypothetical protein
MINLIFFYKVGLIRKLILACPKHELWHGHGNTFLAIQMIQLLQSQLKTLKMDFNF